MVKVVRLHQIGGPEELRIEDIELRAPGAGEAIVRIEAIGLNRAEALYRQGRYIAPPKTPSFIGVEAVGVIDSVGPDVTNFKPGQRVSVLPFFGQGEYGVYGEMGIVPVSALIPAPEGMPAIEAAAIWMQYLTAMGILEAGAAGPEDYVIIPAASSSVGIAAIQIANWVGAEPIAATRTSAKADALKKLGARHVIATQEVDVEAEVARITGGKGARIVFDPVGGPFVETWAKTMAERGILMVYGSLSGETTPYPHRLMASKGLSLRGWVSAEIIRNPERLTRHRALILRGLATGRLTPVIDKVFPFAQIADAHRYLESNQQVGKIVVTI